LFYLSDRDLTQKKVAREEEFGRLRISVANDGEDVLVSQLRGNYRLFLVTGSPEHVDTVTAGLAKYKTLLKEKNVIIATLDMTGDGANRVVVAESEKQEPGAAVAALAAEFAAARVASDAELSAPTVIEFGNKSKKTKSTAPRRKPGGTSTPTEKVRPDWAFPNPGTVLPKLVTVRTDYSDCLSIHRPIHRPIHDVDHFSFPITEVAGRPRGRGYVARLGGERNRARGFRQIGA
jgi:hypothetical protein